GRAVVPQHVGAGGDDVVALESGHGNERDVLDPDALGEAAIVVHNFLVDGLGIVDQIHLVDGDDDVLDSDERHQVAVAARLGKYAFARVYHDNGDIGGRCAGDHVARVLFMPRCVGHNELALVSGKGAVGHIARNALLAFGRQAVDEPREVGGGA